MSTSSAKRVDLFDYIEQFHTQECVAEALGRIRSMLAAQGKIMKKLLLFVFVWCAITAQADEVDKFINDILDAELTVNYCMSINRDLINGKVLAEIANLLVAARRWL